MNSKNKKQNKKETNKQKNTKRTKLNIFRKYHGN